MTRTMLAATIALVVFNVAFSAAGQTSAAAPAATNAVSAGDKMPALELREQLRAWCITEHRSICGRIIRIFPNGILVESGYTNLARGKLTRSWLVPGSVVASRAQNLVESREPGALCVGTIFLTDLPRGKPHQYDYVIIAGYPTGEFAYTSVGAIQKTVRRFSANLDKAVKTNLGSAGNAVN